MSFWDASLETANRWYDISWYGLLISGVIATLAAGSTVIFLFLQFWSSGIRERYMELRTSGLETQTERAKADVAKAGAEIAKANEAIAEAKKQTAALQKDAAQARLETERLKETVAWREVTPAQAALLAEALRGQHFAIPLSFTANAPEAARYADQLADALVAA